MEEDDQNEEIDNEVNDIISQIMSQSNSLKKTIREKEIPSQENLEEFIIKNSSELVQVSLEVINDLKPVVQTDKEMIAMAELLRAATSCIETLSKLKIAENKNKVAKELKLMDIESKETLQEAETQNRLMASREDLLKLMIQQGLLNKEETKDPVIDV